MIERKGGEMAEHACASHAGSHAYISRVVEKLVTSTMISVLLLCTGILTLYKEVKKIIYIWIDVYMRLLRIRRS